jgi:glucose/mannose transport system substrate-binding protein
MTPRFASAESRWALRHAWHGEADRAALALCRDRLSGIGIELVDADPAHPPNAIKMHGMELVDARAAGAQTLHDLHGVAVTAGWAQRLPPLVRHYMVVGERWHGVPMGIHRANVAWVNADLAAEIGTEAPADAVGLLDWMARARLKTESPLAVGAEPWQVGVLFEAIVLAVAGSQAYRRAFERLDCSAWGEPAMVEATACLMALRSFVSDEHLGLPWAEQLARVRRGEAAIQWMGDWVRAAGCDGVVEWAAPGTAGWFVAIVDFFVPLAGGPAGQTERIAAALTDEDFQRRFALRKGCMPAFHDAMVDVDPLRARLLANEAGVLPSLSFDQCCAIPAKQALLEVVASHFVHRRGAAACTRALAGLAH